MVRPQIPLVVDVLLQWNGTDDELSNIITALLTYLRQLADSMEPNGWEKVVKSLPMFLRPKIGFYNIQ